MISLYLDDALLLENEHVLLRPLVTEDYKHLKHFVTEEPSLWQFSLVPIVGENGLKEYKSNALTQKAAKKEYPFIVFDKRSNQYAGCTRFYDIQPNNKMLQLGYTWYGAAYQGTGLNKNCKFLLLQFAFEKLEVDRIEFRADNDNEKSIAAMKSIGCVVEGILRNHAITATGKKRSSIVLSILKEEWYGSVKEKLTKKISF